MNAATAIDEARIELSVIAKEAHERMAAALSARRRFPSLPTP
jgi:hypothetical protein